MPQEKNKEDLPIYEEKFQDEFESTIIKSIHKLIDQSEEITTKKKLENSEEWSRTWMCIHIFSRSYREVNGKGHAICDSNGNCKIHYDKANPHHDLVKHIIYDSPYRILKILFSPILYTYLLYYSIWKTEK